MAQTVKRLSTMQETRVRSLGWEDPLEKEMAPHSSTLAWKIPWTEEPDKLQSMGSQRVGHDWTTSLLLMLSSNDRIIISRFTDWYSTVKKNLFSIDYIFLFYSILFTLLLKFSESFAPYLVRGSTFRPTLMSFSYFPAFLEVFLTSWHNKKFQGHVIFSRPQYWIL